MIKGYEVKLIESNNPFKDILIPASRREGYVDGASSVVPVYFTRQVGLAGLDSLTKDQFYNELYQLDKELSTKGKAYLKIDNSIALPNNDEVKWAITGISKGHPTKNQTLRDSIVTQVINSGVLHMFSTNVQNQLVIPGFSEVIDLYMRSERNINESKIENFAIKLIAWLKRYEKVLFKNTGDKYEIPKVLCYGNIKNHEVYFLTLLALIGCDILYVTTDKSTDDTFLNTDKVKIFANKIELEESCENQPFPLTEKIIPKATVAYNASRELHKTLFNGEIGIFKARQFEGGHTKAVTLRTTYDEMKILWNEEARMRPEFKVDNETVYVPNLFAKINGTQEELSEYWKDIQGLRKADDVIFYGDLPFSKVKYSKQELYSSAFLFDKTGLVIKEQLFKSPLYKLNYLKPSLQEYIVEKINEIILSNLFIKEMDEELRLKVLMTIITMNDELLRLLEVFDFTGKIPKIIFYNGNKNQFTEEDAILLAFFYLVGLDVLIFTPTNYSNIENWIAPHYYSTHQLPKVQFDLEYKSGTITKIRNEIAIKKDGRKKEMALVEGGLKALGLIWVLGLIISWIF